MEAFLRLLSVRKEGKKKIMTVALVSDRTDRYNTVFNVEGCITDFRNVIVDFNHNGVSTGANLEGKRVEEIELDDGTKINALIGDITVFEDSELRNAEGDSVGNALEAIENGRIASVSVFFDPLPTEIFTNETTGATFFNKWKLLALSLLDTIPGQEDSMILSVRSGTLNLSKNKMGKREDENLKNKEEETKTVDETVDEETNVEEEPTEDVEDKEVVEEKAEENVEEEGKDEEPEGKSRMFVGEFAKNAAGELAVVTKVVVEEDDGSVDKTITLEKLDGSTEDVPIEVFFVMENPTWEYVSLDMAVLELFQAMKGGTGEGRSNPEEKEEEVEENEETKEEEANEEESEVEGLKRQLEEEKDKREKVEENYRKLSKSPDEAGVESEDVTAEDMQAERAKEDTHAVANAQARARR